MGTKLTTISSQAAAPKGVNTSNGGARYAATRPATVTNRSSLEQRSGVNAVRAIKCPTACQDSYGRRLKASGARSSRSRPPRRLISAASAQSSITASRMAANPPPVPAPPAVPRCSRPPRRPLRGADRQSRPADRVAERSTQRLESGRVWPAFAAQFYHQGSEVGAG